MTAQWVTAPGWTVAHLPSPYPTPGGRWQTRCGRNTTATQRDGAGHKLCGQCAGLDDRTWAKPRVVPTERTKEYRPW